MDTDIGHAAQAMFDDHETRLAALEAQVFGPEDEDTDEDDEDTEDEE